MYNRYIPQSDGTFQRSRVPEHTAAPPAPPVPDTAAKQAEPPIQRNPAPPRPASPQPARLQRREPPEPHTAMGVGSFLRQLLPQNFDTEDMIVVLLLLLMSGDSSEDQNAALLTLGLYLFL